jgi:hypothetical protein
MVSYYVYKHLPFNPAFSNMIPIQLLKWGTIQINRMYGRSLYRCKNWKKIHSFQESKFLVPIKEAFSRECDMTKGSQTFFPKSPIQQKQQNGHTQNTAKYLNIITVTF